MRSTDATAVLLETLKTRIEVWAPPRPWAVAYSGGRDSGVLLWALARLSPPGTLTALHVDHGWRPQAEREAEAALVLGWCSRLGVTLRSFGPPSDSARTESGARDHRYAAFRVFLEENPGASVWLAHHADDQAETVLMRLLKGRSWQGLAGMPSRRGPYLRPLLDLRASVLAEAALEQGVPYHTDSTNSDPRHTRNYLRSRVFPGLSGRFPRVVESLVRFAEVWAEVSPEAAPDLAWHRVPGGAQVGTPVWDSWSPVRRQAQLLALTAESGFSGPLSRRFLESVTRQGRLSGAQGAGWLWRRTPDRVLWKRVVQRPAKEYFILAEPGQEGLSGAGSFSWSRDRRGPGDVAVPGIDPEHPWVWRSAAPGMRFASADDPDWGKDLRRRRLGSLDPERCALAVQDGLICAVVDVGTGRVVWSRKDPGKLHNPGIFVTLGKRSEYERR